MSESDFFKQVCDEGIAQSEPELWSRELPYSNRTHLVNPTSRTNYCLDICGVAVPNDFLATRDVPSVSIIGASGSGKTILAQTSIHSFMKHNNQGETCVILDSKGSILPFAKGLSDRYGVQLYYINLTDPRAHALDIQAELNNSEENAFEFVSEMMPVSSSSDPIWEQSAQASLLAVILFLMQSGRPFGMEDIYGILQVAPEKLVQYMAQTPSGKISAERIFGGSNEKAIDSVLFTLDAKARPLRAAAIHQYYTSPRQYVSFRDIARTGGIVVISQDYTTVHMTQPFIRYLIRQFVMQKLETPDYSQPDSMIYIDEISSLGKNPPAILEAVIQGRSKRLMTFLSSQSRSQFDRIFGREGAVEIMNCCDFKALLRCNDFESATYQSRMCGQRYVQKTSESFGTSYSMSTSEELAAAIEPNWFFGLPKPSPSAGLSYAFISPETGVLKLHRSGAYMQEHQPPRAAIAGRQYRKNANLPPWSPKALGATAGNNPPRPLSRQHFIHTFQGNPAIAGFAYDFVSSCLHNAMHQAYGNFS
ncbi:conserved hypothetical protein [Hyella patelloides LEGE 07179]|uniref:Type IV secretion system coupling protein TraD DNA-binding domain-containing protein n=1 Tax=Hyella patelloides LEGE 07179 TaxID=945734 RepID=A0A563W4Q6_9CYAN|nr:type IV secretion system DNA-binding domain-containing protein [Hyella patelloides]VEP18664.1 conserved hypothetical protein [Hyella patelloides LEGE 07179]